MSFLAPATLRGRQARQRAIRRTINDLDTAMMCRNIYNVYVASTPEQRSEGSTWYRDAHDLAGGDPLGVGMLAALSPGTSWERNLQHVDDMHQYGDTNHSYGDAITKAKRILHGEAPEDVLGGRKVRSFYANCLRPDRHGPVTIDRHAASVALLGLSADKGGRRTATLSDRDLKSLQRPGAYILIAACYRRVAAALPVPIPAHELQAITWLFWRDAKAYETKHLAEEF